MASRTFTSFFERARYHISLGDPNESGTWRNQMVFGRTDSSKRYVGWWSYVNGGAAEKFKEKPYDKRVRRTTRLSYGP